MAKKRVFEMRRTKENVEEYVLPSLLGIVMRWSQLVFLTPVRLRCVNGQWAVRLSPLLVIFQRFLVFLTDLLVLMALFHDFPAIQHYVSQHSNNIMSIALSCSEMLTHMTIYSICALNSPWRIKRNVIILRQIQKMKSTFKCGDKVIKYERVKSCLLFAFIFCKIITLLEAMLLTSMNFYSKGILVFAFSAAIIWYQRSFMVFFHLELGLMINEVRSTVSMLNDELHSWLETPTVTCIQHIRQNFMLHKKKMTNKVHATTPSLQGPTCKVRPKASIRHLSDCYYNIGNMVRQMNSDNGAYLVVFVAILYLQLLVALYNMMIAAELNVMEGVIRQVVWTLIYMSTLLILVEPSHRLQEQLKRTCRLVSKMAGKSGHWVQDPTHLEPFLLQVQMKIAALEPMGMFTVARPLVASIIGGAITTFIMLSQYSNVSTNLFSNKAEVLVPEPLRVVLWIARTMGVAPARLRRARDGWLLSVSSSLAKLQRMIVVLTVVLVLTLGVLRTILADTIIQKCAQISGTCFAKVIHAGDLALTLLTYLLGAWAAPAKLKAVKSLIRQTQKIKSSFNYDASKIKYIGAINKMFLVYVIWHISTAANNMFSWMERSLGEQQGNVLVVVSVGFFGVIYYQFTMLPIISMMICAMILELKLTITLLNDKLEDLLQSPNMPSRETKLKLYLRELPQRAKISGSFSKDTSPLDEDLESTRHINWCHDMICDMVAQVDKMHGPFLLLFIMLLFAQLLITLQRLIVGFGSSTAYIKVKQTNVILILFFTLLVLVEPCQRLQDQMDRTRYLLGRLLGQAQRFGIDPAQLDLFILQAQIRDVAVAPMGVIIVGRPLIASIIGIVVTYLIIMIQNQNTSVSP